MSDAARPIPVETLLAERAWVQALARSLVLDDAAADDVVQQTWLAAIEKPPRDASALRGWLSRVVRNAAFESRRRAKRRERWEAMTPARPDDVSPADVVAKADAHRRVVDAVMSLDEPYRAAVLLRFFEGLESDEVARRTGVPVETARTRIKRALVTLRRRLDGDRGGDGRSWAVALLPLVGMKKGTPFGSIVGGAVMGMKSAAAGAAVGALVGALVIAGVMKLYDPAEHTVARAPSPDAPRVESPTPERGGESVAESAPTQSPAPAAKSSLAAAFDAVEIDPPKAVEGAIAGVVRTADGAGVSGVTIRATSRAHATSKGKPSGQDAETPAEAVVRNAIAAEKWRAATQRETATGASGAFSVTGLAEGGYWLAASAKGWSIRTAPGANANDVGPGSSVEYVASAVVDVPVRVIAFDGSTPTEQVLVRWALERGGGGSSAWWKSDGPSIGIEPGTWVLTAEIGKRARSNRVTVTLTPGSTVEPVTLRLEALGAIEGVVRFDPPESAWASAEVTALRKGETDRRSIRPVTVKPPNWKFVVEDLVPGEYELTVASRDEKSSSVAVSVEVKADRTIAEIVVPRPAASKWLAVHVTGPDGAPLPPRDVQFGLRTNSSAGGTGIGVRGIALADGGFLVPIQPRLRDKDMDLGDDVFAGAQWQLEVISTSCGTQALEFDHGKTERLDAKFTTPAKFLPVFENVAGTPLDGRIETILGYPSSNYTQALNNRIGVSVEPGRYVVYVSLLCGGQFDGYVLARLPVDLRAGDNRVPIRIPELSTLTIRIAGTTKGSQVRVEPARRPKNGMNGLKVAASDGGLVVCPELVAGIWRVSMVVGGEDQEMLVRVPVEGEVTFAPTSIAGLSVTVDDESGLLAKSGFQTGDVITAMDGVEIDSMRRLDYCFFGARGHATAAVTVRRGGRDARLSIDPAKFGVRGDYGGVWEPILR